MKVAVRHYLSSELLWTAANSVKLCKDREAIVLGERRDHDVEHRSYAVGAILASVAFLEALVNETFEDCVDWVAALTKSSQQVPNGRASGIEGNAMKLMTAWWLPSVGTEDDGGAETGERTSLLTKYAKALDIAGAVRMPTDQEPWQGTKVLIQLRNAIVHFRPDWHTVGGQSKLDGQLRGKFKPNPLLPPGDGNPWFPSKALASPGAEWAVTTARRFADEWTSQLGVIRVYESEVASFG